MPAHFVAAEMQLEMRGGCLLPAAAAGGQAGAGQGYSAHFRQPVLRALEPTEPQQRIHQVLS